MVLKRRYPGFRRQLCRLALEHVATADMAIVGKGILTRPKIMELNRSSLGREANLMFASALNMEINPKIINPIYTGESLGEAVYHELEL